MTENSEWFKHELKGCLAFFKDLIYYYAQNTINAQIIEEGINMPESKDSKDDVVGVDERGYAVYRDAQGNYVRDEDGTIRPMDDFRKLSEIEMVDPMRAQESKIFVDRLERAYQARRKKKNDDEAVSQCSEDDRKQESVIFKEIADNEKDYMDAHKTKEN